MRTPPASTEASWVCVPRIGLGTYQVGYPVCMRVRRSHLCTGRSAITKWILGSRHNSCRSAFCISRERGLTRVSPLRFLQVMLGRLLSSSFYRPLGVFPREFPLFVMMSLHFLPMLHLLRVSQPIMAIPAKLSSCACAINSDRILRLLISSPAFEGKTSTRYLAAFHWVFRTPLFPCSR